MAGRAKCSQPLMRVVSTRRAGPVQFGTMLTRNWRRFEEASASEMAKVRPL